MKIRYQKNFFDSFFRLPRLAQFGHAKSMLNPLCGETRVAKSELEYEKANSAETGAETK